MIVKGYRYDQSQVNGEPLKTRLPFNSWWEDYSKASLYICGSRKM